MKKWVKHPCIVEDENGRLSLRIFHYFYCEMSLPKYQKSFNFAEYKDEEEMMFSREDWESLQDGLSVSASRDNDRQNVNYINSLKNQLNKKLPFFQKLWNKIRKIDPVEKTFEQIKNSKGNIGNDLKKAYDVVEVLIKRATATNQISVIDQLKQYKNVLASEMILSKHGCDQYVTEEKIIEFFKKCDRGVKIDYIRNYDTLIPFEVAEKKNELDKLGVFDNYVVMHYDPNVSVFKESSEDREAIRRKDPILFGLIKGSRKLYFVADWITDEDDLTLAELNIVVENATSRLANLKVESDDAIANISSWANELKETIFVANEGHKDM